MATILLPTDFSDRSLDAAAYALTLVGAADHDVLLVHAYFDLPDISAPVPATGAQVLKASMEGMAAFEQRFRARFPGQAVKSTVEYGELNVVLSDLADKHTVDLVVMTSETSPAGPHAGNASYLVKHTRLPVLVVPDDRPFRGLRTILLGDEHRTFQADLLGPVVRYARAHGASVLIAHALADPDEQPDPQVVAQYDAVFAGVPHGFTSIPGEDPALALSNLAERDGVDLVVVTHHHTGLWAGLFHRSTAKHLVMLARVPMLVLQR